MAPPCTPAHGNGVAPAGAGVGTKPLHVHANKLTSKILELQEHFEEYRRDRISDVVSKMEVLEDKMDIQRRCNEGRAEFLKTQINLIQEDLTMNRINREIMDRRKTEQVVLVESTLQLELVAEVEERRTKEEKLLELQDKLYFDLKHDIVEEVSRRKSNLPKVEARFKDEIAGMVATVKKLKKIREAKLSSVLVDLQTSITPLKKRLQKEKEERTAKWEEAVRQIHDLERRFSKTIEKESRTREDTQSNLLQLLEMTAQRVEVALRGNAVPTSAE